MIVKTHQAKTQLSKLIAAALAGEEVVIARGSQPVVRLTPVAGKPTARPKRKFAGRLEFLHKNPFDRLPIAQALVEDMSLVSNERLCDAAGVTRPW